MGKKLKGNSADKIENFALGGAGLMVQTMGYDEKLEDHHHHRQATLKGIGTFPSQMQS